MDIAVPASAISLVVVVAPSGVLYARRHTRLDCASVWISASCVALGICDILALRFVPIQWHGF
jgi:hypothetical protein